MDTFEDYGQPDQGADAGQFHTMQDNQDVDMDAGTSVLPDNGFAGDTGDMGDAPYDAGGNGDAILSYQDPLNHAQEYQPAAFDLGTQGDFPSDTPEHGEVFPQYTVAPEGGIMLGEDANALPGVKNGMLVDDSQLSTIAADGMLQGTQHINAEDESRSEEAKEEFLHQNGYTQIPAGYEIHHIVPLSEGGADDPQNMILLRTDQHDAVTREHEQFYGWHD